MSLIVTLSGSPAPQSRTRLLAEHVAAALSRDDFEVAGIDVRDLPPADVLHARFDAPAIKDAVALVARAAGLVVATPVYKAAYSGVLKAFLDLLPQDGLAGKVVLPLATGGTLAHLLSIDYALRPVLHALGASHVIGGLFVVDKQLVRTPAGTLDIDAEIRPRLEQRTAELAASVRRLAGAPTQGAQPTNGA